MPWINLTVRRGALTREQQAATIAKLTDALMFWEKIPDTPQARQFMKGWVYEVDETADYVAGSAEHEAPSYFVEVRIPQGRLDLLAKQGIHRDFCKVLIETDGSPPTAASLHRIWITIVELDVEDWSIGGHTDWLRSYVTALSPT